MDRIPVTNPNSADAETRGIDAACTALRVANRRIRLGWEQS